MIIPEMDGEYNYTQSSEGGFEFDEVPTNLLKNLLNAFGQTAVNPGKYYE